jgi:hypothetical protein
MRGHFPARTARARIGRPPRRAHGVAVGALGGVWNQAGAALRLIGITVMAMDYAGAVVRARLVQRGSGRR